MKALIALFLSGLVTFGFLAVAVMDHSMPVVAVAGPAHVHGTTQADAPLTQHTPLPSPFTTCSDLHASFLGSFSQATPGSGMFSLVLLAVIALAASIAGLLASTATSPTIRFAQWQRHLFQRISGYFNVQQYSWLAMLEKRDPAYAFVLA